MIYGKSKWVCIWDPMLNAQPTCAKDSLSMVYEHLKLELLQTSALPRDRSGERHQGQWSSAFKMASWFFKYKPQSVSSPNILIYFVVWSMGLPTWQWQKELPECPLLSAFTLKYAQPKSYLWQLMHHSTQQGSPHWFTDDPPLILGSFFPPLFTACLVRFPTLLCGQEMLEK